MLSTTCTERLGPLGRLAGPSPQALVLGMHRSGTSALTSLLDRMGFYAGPDESLMPADDHNARGYWELGELQAFNERLLSALGASWMDVLDLDPRRLNETARVRFQGRARLFINHLDSYGPWVIKDPRLCLLLPIWLEVLDRPVCILIHRHPLAVARSLSRRNGLPTLVGIALWERYNLAALEYSRGLPRALVSYRELVDHPAGAAAQLVRSLRSAGVQGIDALRRLSPEDARALLDSSLEHHVSSPEEDLGYLNDRQRELLGSLECGSALAYPVPPLSAGAREVLREHVRQARERRATIQSLTERIQRIEETLDQKRQAAEEREALLSAVFSSRSWRLGFGLTRLFRRKELSAFDRWKSLSDP